MSARIEYSDKYADDSHEYRYVGTNRRRWCCLLVPGAGGASLLGSLFRSVVHGFFRLEFFSTADLDPLSLSAHHRYHRLSLPQSIQNSHVILPKEVAKTMPKSRLLSETEWRAMGVQQSRGWQHYAVHRYVTLHHIMSKGPLVWIVISLARSLTLSSSFCRAHSPEPHILLFRRPLGTDPQTGQVDPELLQLALEDYKDQPGLSHQAVGVMNN
jgi:cyclin-dependent kinase regulatory subunit CKS1